MAPDASRRLEGVSPQRRPSTLPCSRRPSRLPRTAKLIRHLTLPELPRARATMRRILLVRARHHDCPRCRKMLIQPSHKRQLQLPGLLPPKALRVVVSPNPYKRKPEAAAAVKQLLLRNPPRQRSPVAEALLLHSRRNHYCHSLTCRRIIHNMYQTSLPMPRSINSLRTECHIPETTSYRHRRRSTSTRRYTTIWHPVISLLSRCLWHQ